MGNAHWSIDATAVMVAVGGVAVCGAYWDVIGGEGSSFAPPPSSSSSSASALPMTTHSHAASHHHHPYQQQNHQHGGTGGGGGGDEYTHSRFWIGISSDTAMVLWPLQLLAGTGFVAFTASLFLDAYRRRDEAPGIGRAIAHKGVLSYMNGGVTVAAFAVFFLCSYMWPYATRDYLDGGGESTWDMARVALSLAGAAISVVVMVAGAFEADMHPVAIWGVLAFATVVVLVDGVGWNAKLIHSHYHGPGHGHGLIGNGSSPEPTGRRTLIYVKVPQKEPKSTTLRL